MSVNIFENGKLRQIAGNVPMNRVELMEQLAAQAAAHAEQAAQLAAQAKGIAEGASEKAENTKSESFTLTNVNGWKRALEFTGNGLALNFSMSATDAQAAVSGVLNAALNASCLISQLSSRDLDRLHRIDKAAVLFQGDRTVLFIHTPENIANIKLVITGSYQQAVYENIDEALPDGAYIYNFGVNSGIIADRAINDEDGNNIAEGIANALPKSGGTLTGMLTPNGGISCAGKDGYIAYPKDGSVSTTQNQTGFIKIRLPVFYSVTMLKFVVTIYNFAENESTDYYISGYCYKYNEDKQWLGCTAVCVGKMGESKSDLAVRFGDDGEKIIVTIGEENTLWNYTIVKIHDVLCGFENASYSTWTEGWQVSIDSTPLPTVKTTIYNTHVASIAPADQKVDDFAAIHHRNTYRGRNLGNSFTAAQKAAIRNGTFEGLYVGDYWVINGVTWRIVDINYWLGTGDVECTTPHLVIMPDTPLYDAPMNDTNTTAGGYVGSKMYTANLENAKSMINSAFGAGYILNHREYLTNAVADGSPSAGSWYDSKVELPNEIMMYGGYLFAPAGDGSFIPNRYTVDKTQLALMQLYQKFINLFRQSYWMRDIVSTAVFAAMNNAGYTNCYNATISNGVRPVFGLTGGTA